MTSANEYWKKRALYAKRQHLKSTTEYELAMRYRLNNLENDIEKETLSWLKKYATNENVSLKQAAQSLSSIDSTKFSMTLEEFEAKARSGGYDKVLNSEYYKSRIARLKDLQAQLSKMAEPYADNEANYMELAKVEQYKNTYLFDNYSNYVVLGEVVNLNHFNEQAIKDLVYQPWHGKTFSQRIWKNYTKILPEVLTDGLLRGVLLGQSPKKITSILRSKFKNIKESYLHRLVVTELGHTYEQATSQFYKDSDIKHYQYLATLESHTCEVCARLDGKVFKVKDEKSGVNYPLIHPYCRCTTMPYDETLPPIETRWYRDPKTGKGAWGKLMSFNSWKKYQESVNPEIGYNIKKIAPYITFKEARALSNYVSSDSYKINYLLRSGSKLDEADKEMIKDLDHLLKKLPKYRNSNPLQRDYFFGSDEETLNFVEMMTKTDYFEDPAYISTSKSHYGEGTEQIHVIIKKSKSGADISGYNTSEKEVLFPRNTKFIVKKIYYSEQGVITVEWEEK